MSELLLAIVSIALMLVSLTSTPTTAWQSEVIERGYALYCADTGDFAWKGECNE